MKKIFCPRKFEPIPVEIDIITGGRERILMGSPFLPAAHIILPAGAMEKRDYDWLLNMGGKYHTYFVNFVQPAVEVIEFADYGDAVLFKVYAYNN